MDDRTPGGAVRLQGRSAPGHRRGDEMFRTIRRAGGARHHRPWRGGRRRTEAAARPCGRCRAPTAPSILVGRHRVEGSGLVDHLVAGEAVVVARRCEQEAPDAGHGSPRRPANACPVIDVVSDFRVEVAQRIVRQRRKVGLRRRSPRGGSTLRSRTSLRMLGTAAIAATALKGAALSRGRCHNPSPRDPPSSSIGTMTVPMYPRSPRLLELSSVALPSDSIRTLPAGSGRNAVTLISRRNILFLRRRSRQTARCFPRARCARYTGS